MPTKPELLDSDCSDIDSWDSGSETKINEAAQMLDELCNNDNEMDIDNTEPTNNNVNVATLVSTLVAGQPAVVKVSIPRVRAPSLIRTNKVELD